MAQRQRLERSFMRNSCFLSHSVCPSLLKDETRQNSRTINPRAEGVEGSWHQLQLAQPSREGNRLYLNKPQLGKGTLAPAPFIDATL